MELPPYHYIGISLIIIVVLLAIVIVIPVREKKKRKRKKRDINQEAPSKDWEKVAQRLERQLRTSEKQGRDLNQDVTDKEKQIAVERVRVRKLEEKLSQERQWLKKEEVKAEKRGGDFQRLQDELKKLQESYSCEHIENIKFQKEINILKKEVGDLTDKRRTLELETRQQKSKIDVYRKDIAHLKKDVHELQKKKEDESWVAKSDFLRVERELKEAQKELERVKREQQ